MEGMMKLLQPHSRGGLILRVLFFTMLVAMTNVIVVSSLGPYLPDNQILYPILTGSIVGAPFILLFFVVMMYQRRLQQRLSFLSRNDGLTGLNNRFSFFEIAEQRNQQIQSGILLVLDADHFKLINDSYGHQAGDYCLKSIADTLKRNLREGDVIGRIGGEEFAILLANIGPGQAQVIGERLTMPIPFYAGPQAQYPTATLSVGAVMTS